MTEAQHLYGVAAAVCMAASLCVAVVRWFHMCQPYDQKPGYYYPGRPYATAIHLVTLLLFPYVFHPDSADAWFLMKIFFLPMEMFLLTILLFGYFGSVMKRLKWKAHAVATGIPVILGLTASFVLAMIPGEQLADASLARKADIVIYALGVLTTLAGFASVLTVLKWAKSIDEDDFSSPLDFPVRFARKTVMMYIGTALLLWTNALLDSPLVMAVLMLVLSATSVILLIMTLHPNRNGPEVLEEEEAAAAETGDNPGEETGGNTIYDRKLAEAKISSIIYAIQAVVVEREAYLEPHLTLQDVADRTGYSRTYIAGIFKSELGGFFTYINTLRLEYAEAYQRQHPNASINEVATESGFSSRQTYYSAKAKLLGS